MCYLPHLLNRSTESLILDPSARYFSHICLRSSSGATMSAQKSEHFSHSSCSSREKKSVDPKPLAFYLFCPKACTVYCKYYPVGVLLSLFCWIQCNANFGAVVHGASQSELRISVASEICLRFSVTSAKVVTGQ